MMRRRLNRTAIPAAVIIIVLLAAGVFPLFLVEFDPALLSSDRSAGRGAIFTDRFGRELRFLPDPQGERARWVPIPEVPETVRNAFIAAEDERFHTHHGFDGIAILRALRSNIAKNRIVSGASTISQQVVRLLYDDAGTRSGERGMIGGSVENAGNPGRRRTYREKLLELVRSVKMERVLSKEEILEQYLNRVPMGNNLVGVETAARAYFGVSVKNLSASDAALLASLPKAPSMLNPYGKGLARLLARRDWVLGRMETLGLLSREHRLAAVEQRPRLRKLAYSSAAPHVVDMLLKRGGHGRVIRTTIDLDLQRRVREILASHAERLRYRGATQAAAIVIHNPTMEVLAAAGSLEYSGRDGGFNNGVLAQRSAGSTLKPFLYALAIESGETPATLLEDTERTYRSPEGQYSPINYDRREYGPVKARAALGSSLNLSAVKVLQRTGEDRFYELLTRLDLINHPERGPEHYGLGMAIGNPEVSPEQLATAYAMLANYGVYRKARYVLSGGGPGGGGRDIDEKRYVLLPQTAYIVTDMLEDPTARMLTFRRSRVMMDFPFRVAVKTGTSTFYRDLWTAGYTPDYTVAVWTGNFDGSPTKNLSGSTAAAPIFSDIMNFLYRRSVPVAFGRPRGVARAEVCGYSGMKPAEFCAHTVSELFIAGTEPKEPCTFHTAGRKRHELPASFAGWLFDKNRADSSGTFRLAGFGDDLNKVFQDPWEGAATEREPAVRARNVPAGKDAPIAPVRLEGRTEVRPDRHYSIGAASGESVPSGNAPNGGEIRIVYPLDRDRFVINRSERRTMIMLRATVARPVQYVEWFVNGNLYKRTGPPYQAVWGLEEGRYRITAVTPESVGDTVQVTVE